MLKSSTKTGWSIISVEIMGWVIWSKNRIAIFSDISTLTVFITIYIL